MFPTGQDCGAQFHPKPKCSALTPAVSLVSLSWQHLFSKVTIYQGEEQQLSDSTLKVTADHSQRQTIQYHELFNEEKGQGRGLVTQRLCKYLLQQLSTFAKTESKYE